MPLIAHILVATSIAGRIPNLFLAFIFGVVISIIIDLIPHHKLKLRTYAPFTKNIKRIDNKLYLIGAIDLISSVIVSIILIITANQFINSDIFHYSSISTVIAAIIGSIVLAIIQLPYLVFGKGSFSKQIFEFKNRFSLYDSGLSGYLVIVSIIIVAIVLLSQVLKTPFGTI